MFKTKEHQHFSADVPLPGWFSIPKIKTIPNIGAVLGALMDVILPAEGWEWTTGSVMRVDVREQDTLGLCHQTSFV